MHELIVDMLNNRQMDEWKNGWMNGWMNGRMDEEWMEEWMDGMEG